MSMNSANASPRRKNFVGRQNSLPTYEQATEKVLQETFIQTLAAVPSLDSDTQAQRSNNNRTINNTSFNGTTTTQFSSRNQELGRRMPEPAMVHYRNYRVWNMGQPASTNYTNLTPVEKESMLGFHIVGFLIIIMIVLLLIVFITKVKKLAMFN
ncbi:uncharacterized protein LOC131663966 [Phymastichus coffea]|uniref:uncharacterized protein LOC131663966 n=1 Tax=Phymastichus coffea TaxID=108790 RepID=UPI00273BD8CC|nr:uncharacterized protein LOC131663966 [Phymastichus coffea]XP_058790755.1 uncharacterized protein LOC131663966 [Phymastichus coffea]